MACGISKATFLEEEAPRLESWLNQNYHGQMGYMARNFDKRLDPTKLVPGAKSVVSLAYNYFPKEAPKDKTAPKIARYAYGKDYHRVIKDSRAPDVLLVGAPRAPRLDVGPRSDLS